MILRSVFQMRMRSALLFLGLLAVSAGMLLIGAASQTSIVVVDRDLASFWRTTYDILVRPGGARSPIEEKYSLVEANHLSGIWGGITFKQYEAIKSIPGVEVAAPIAMLGYVGAVAQGNEIPFPPLSGAYVFNETATVDDGSHTYIPSEFPRRHYYYFDRNPQERPLDWEEAYRYLDGLTVNDYSPIVNGTFWFPIFLAAVDPLQEAALVGLDQALLEGQYLTRDESLASRMEFVPDPGSNNPKTQINLPILINATTYLNLSYHSELKRVILPPDVGTVEDILARGGTDFLNSLPSETVAVAALDSQGMYQQMIESLRSQSILFGGRGMSSIASALMYREAAPLPTHSGLVFEIQLPEDSGDQAEIQYRRSLEAEFDVLYIWNIKGIFDIEDLHKPADVSRVPLETYFPPVAILRYDEQGYPVESPRELRPTLNPAGYIQSPPMMLTTLEAARALRGDAAISAIRVRVALESCHTEQPEICPLTPASQRKIEAVASEIARHTSLTVDIMVGSSPTRVLVHVPGIGYVEEQWIRKGVNLTYKQGIQIGNWLLMMTLLVAAGMYTLDLAWAEVTAQRRMIALQKALGWRSRTVFGQVIGRVLLIGVATALAGSLAAWGTIRLMKWQLPAVGLLIGFPLAMLGLATLGSLLPAWLASRVPPIAEMQHGGLQHRRTGFGPALGWWSYAWSGLMRRPGRSLLTATTAALSAALLTLLLAVTVEQQAMLSATLLGEFILVRVEGFHYAIVSIGFSLTALSTANAMLGGIDERRREIGILKAVGWRSKSVAGLFMTEGILLGIAGGALGTLLGSSVFLYFYGYGSLSPASALAILFSVSVPGIVGALAALYPARVAARVPPAEVVRYE